MEVQLTQSMLTHIAEIGPLARAVEARVGWGDVLAWQEALKAISRRPLHPDFYVQIARFAFAAIDSEAAMTNS